MPLRRKTAERAIATMLLLVAIVHAIPAFAFLDASRLQALYGVDPVDVNLEVLLRHRALLFFMVSGVLALGAVRPTYQPLALAIGWLSILSFLFLAGSADGMNPLMQRVLTIDWALVPVLAAATAIRSAGARSLQRYRG